MLNVDGTKIWYSQSGKISTIPTIYLHGGPGYNSYAFKYSAGPLLEEHLNMVYLDQRGGGRSPVTDSTVLGINYLIKDVEMLRIKLGTNKINFIAHSFGGLVALEYIKKYKNHVNRLVLVDISADLKSVFENQLKEYADIGKMLKSIHVNELENLVLSEAPVSSRLMKVFKYLPIKEAHRHLLYATDEGQAKNIEFDSESKLGGSDLLYNKLSCDGYLDSHHEELMTPIGLKAILFAGSKSRCIGAKNINEAAKAWSIPVEWFEKSGHFIYIEETQKFVSETVSFFAE